MTSTDNTTTAIPVGRRLPVSWWTVGIFAMVLAAADGFWATSLRRAIGYIGSTQEPFRDWLLYIAVMVPIFAATVVGALWLAQRLSGGRRHAVRVVSAAVLVVVLTTIVGVGQIALTSVYDYRDQARQVVQIHHLHAGSETVLRLDPGQTLPARPVDVHRHVRGQARHAGRIHLRAIKIAVVLLLATNAVLVLWTMALRGGRLWARRRTARPATVAGGHRSGRPDRRHRLTRPVSARAACPRARTSCPSARTGSQRAIRAPSARLSCGGLTPEAPERGETSPTSSSPLGVPCPISDRGRWPSISAAEPGRPAT